MRSVLLLLGVAFLAAGSVSYGQTLAGGRILRDKKNACQMMVPNDWKGERSTAQPADHKGLATVHGLAGKSWTDSKPMARQVMPPTQIIEDSATRLWYAYGATEGETHWYISIPGKDMPCIAQITFHDESFAPLAKQMAESLSPAQ
jgi:hypothetical protein